MPRQRHDRAGGTLIIDLGSDAELASRVEKGDTLGWIVRLEERLSEGEELSVLLLGDRKAHRLETRISQIFRSGQTLYGTMLEVVSRGDLGRPPGVDLFFAGGAPDCEPTPPARFASTQTPASPESPESPELRESPAARVSPSGVDAGSASPAPDSETGPAERTGHQDAAEKESDESEAGPTYSGETLGASSVFDLKKLKPPEKMRLASKANRQQRQILLRDSSPQIAMQLLNNPQIEAKEVLEMAKNPQTASGVLQRIAQDRRWSGNYEVQLALVKNPRTPSPLALRFVDLLRRGDLRDLAKSQALRDNIRRAILRVYLQRQ